MRTTSPKNTATSTAPKSKPFFSKPGNKSNQAEPPFFGPSTIQPKLAIGQPGDTYEQEADAMADQVMQMSEAPANGGETIQPKPLSVLQRKCTSCEEEAVQTKPLMMKSEGNGLEATAELSSQLHTSKGSGAPLAESTNNFMNTAFGTDFSKVRVHTGGNAIQMNQELHARAFTHGSDIYFNRGEYAPGTADGKRLLAHELTHTMQQGAVTNNLSTGSTLQRDTSRTADPLNSFSDTNTKIGPVIENARPVVQKQESEERSTPQCATQFRQATSFQSLILLVEAAENKLNSAGITSNEDQIHALRGIYYGTTWSLDYAVESSTTRNEGFQRFTRPSEEPSRSVPPDIRAILDCGLFAALQSSQDVTDGDRHVDFGHLIIGLDARGDPARNQNIQYPGPMGITIDMGGTGPEIVTWLGDLGGAAAALSTRRGSRPNTSASSVFSGSDYGGSINLEGDIAGFVVATSRTTSVTMPSFSEGRKLSHALRAYFSDSRSIYRRRARTFLRMYGGTFDPSNDTLTNATSLRGVFAGKIQVFACNYLASRVRDGHLTFNQARAAADHVIPTSQEVAATFVHALIDTHTTGRRIEARWFPSPLAASPGACRQQIAAGAVLGIMNGDED